MICRFLIVFLWHFFCICGQEEIFLQANKVYLQKQYTQAAELYISINNKGPAVWQNLGNCYWYLERYKDAFIAYNRALKNACLSDSSFLKNQKKQSYKRWTGNEESGAGSWKEWIVLRCSICTLLQWHIILIVFWSIGIFFLYRWRGKKWYKQYVILFFLGLLGLFFIVRCAYKLHQLHGLIVTTTKLFIAPRRDVYAVKHLIPGDGVMIVDSCKEWTKVSVQGVVGWIPSTDYEIL